MISGVTGKYLSGICIADLDDDLTNSISVRIILIEKVNPIKREIIK